ncbi:MAG TPA: ABC transporter permease subunit [Xanthobacteraceae bacterium]|jgi:NitT/TauT family transport system permease protein
MPPSLITTCLRAGSILLLLLLWGLASVLMHDPQVLPGPLTIGRTIIADLATPGPEGASAYFQIGITLARILVAFCASMVAGTGIGLAMGVSRTFERSMLVFIPLMLTMPTILMVFLAVMWFGYGEAGGLVAVMAVVTPFVAVNIFEGAKAMDRSLNDMAVAFQAGGYLRIRKVYLPQLMPYVFAAFRYAFAVTWKIVALAETFGLKFGIGYMFFFWFEQFNMAQVLAWIVIFVILMLALEHGIFARLESRTFAWRTPLAHGS